ncbi:uncharacterized protein LOC111337933 [Stylophora pistillata]|uniref:uncharacterized protein LOC111337933 n=1 Tax=Stylophora pistillata TaxID=50429 RepID=UPI000C04D5C0|nr:uncharacterized protein LOC111337933 [Stylophora pistillata]
MVFVLRQLQEKCREQNKGLYVTFVDLTKAFESVSRSGLWLILKRLGVSPKFLQMVIQLHENERGQVRLNGDLSEPFPISNGVKQGCVLAPTLFGVFFSMMLKQATVDLDVDEGVYISLKKTEVLHQPTLQVEYRPPRISIGDTELKSVQQFTYLGRIISSDAKMDNEIDNRLAKTNGSFGRLFKRVWNNKSLKSKTKIRVYRAVVHTTLLYGSETWVTYRSHIRLLERFHQRCLRTNIHCCDFNTNVEVLEQAEIPRIEAMILKRQLRWAVHVPRMEDHRLPKIVMYGELSIGHRERGAPRKRLKDSLKKSLRTCNIDHKEWSDLATDRGIWRHTMNQATAQFEKDRREVLEDKRQRRKARAASTFTPDTTFLCRYCPQICLFIDF